MLVLPDVLNLTNARACLRALTGALAQEAADVVVDAGSLKQFDSAALAVLLELRRQTLQMGKVFAVQDQPMHLSDLARLYGIADLLPDARGAAPVK